MADTFQKVSAGQPLEIPAATWNALLDSARRFNDQKLGAAQRLPLESNPLVSAVRCLVSNDTGDDLDEFSIVAISSPPITPTDDPFGVQTRPTLSGTTPAAATDTIAILQQPLADGEIGRAAAMGFAICTINLTDVSHTWASATPSDSTMLTSGASGAARILWFASQETTPATGDQLGLVLLNQAGSQDATPAYAANIDVDSVNMDATKTDNPSTWYDASDEFELPAGAYHVTAHIQSDITATSSTNTSGVNIGVRLYNVTAAASISGAPCGHCYPAGVSTRSVQNNPFDLIISLGVDSTLKIQTQSSLTGSGLTISAIRVTGGNIALHQVPSAYFALP